MGRKLLIHCSVSSDQMGNAAATLYSKAAMSATHRPTSATDLIDPITGRQDRLKAVAEVRQFRAMCQMLLTATTDDPRRPVPHRTPAHAVPSPSLQDAHHNLRKLLPQRKLDFEMLSKLPCPCLASKISCQSALQLCLDETTPPSWRLTQQWLIRRPYKDVRFLRIEENPNVWVDYKTVVATLRQLITINTSQLESLGERGKATKALWMWCLAVCRSVLEHQDPGVQQDDQEDIDTLKEEMWGRAWMWGVEKEHV